VNGRYKGEYLQRQTCAKMLLAAGADPNFRDDRGFTPLHKAALSGRDDMIPILVDAGSDPDALSLKEGFSLLHCCFQ